MSTLRRNFARVHRSDGFIVVAVLWIIGALATLASIYALYVANSTVALAAHDDRIQAEALTKAAVELAVYQLSAQAPPDTVLPTRGAFSFRMGGANVLVDFRSEAGRIDLNAAPKELLSGLLRTLGARPDFADTYADRIIGWRSIPADNTDLEAPLYRAAGLNYLPREGPFAHVGELWLVLGLPPALVERAMPYVTIYSGRQDVSVADAAPEVIAAIPGMTPDRLYMALSQPGGPQAAQPVAQGDPSAPPPPESKTSRVTVRLAFDNGRRTSAEVVVLLVEDGDEPYRVLSWRDDFDGTGPGERPRTSVR
jgi:general secretion pathway protein K